MNKDLGNIAESDILLKKHGRINYIGLSVS
jgi:hypothetical protein